MRRPQWKGHTGAAFAAAVVVTIAVAAACRTIPRKAGGAAPRSFSVEAWVRAPVVRVGVLVDVPRVQVTADSGVVVWSLLEKESPVYRAVSTPVATFRGTRVRPGGVVLHDTGQEFQSAYVVPASSGDALRVDGVLYRGIIEVRGDGEGALTVVNVVGVEDYLRGVVPNELSPEAFPQIEALKAQAVAARTYALRNRGQFQAKGYDLCATAACQVYRGLSTESALSDQAIAETRGMAATYEGQPIEALYTSTCGGHTEDGGNIFDGEPTPYLRGVVCVPEKSAWSLVRTTAPIPAGGGEESHDRDAALLVALGVFEPKVSSPASLKGAASEAEIRRWTMRLIGTLKRKGCESAAEGPLTRRGAFFAHVVSSLCWEERAKRLLSPSDPDYLLQVEDREDLSGRGEDVAAALLIQEGILTPFSDNSLGAGKALTRAQAATLLARTAERAGPPGLMAADFQGAERGEIRVRLGESVRSFPLNPQARLFRSLDGDRGETSELSLVAGDRISFVVQDGSVTFLEANQSRLGAAADHTSRYFRWEVRSTPAEVAKGVARYGVVGTVQDVVPRRIGSSGRVVELSVVGSQGELLLRGLKIRWALGLRENLFVVDRELGEHGDVERFVFTGKGWGHGVGLCQVGAYGMARAGSSYAAILSHYYPGIAIEKVY